MSNLQIYFLLQSEQCIQCQQNCQECQNDSECINCQQGFIKTQKRVDQCQACEEGCLQCSNFQNCTKCDEQRGYYLYNNKCLKCQEGCLSCTNGSMNQCIICDQKQNYFKDKNQNCIKCKENQQFDQIKGCVCSQNYLLDEQNTCQPVKSDGSIDCGASFKFDVSSKKCVLCNGDKQIFDSNIKQCICSVGYFQNNSQICQSCQEGCLKCIDQTTCEQCDVKQGYYFQNSNCFKCNQLCLTCNGPTASNCLDCDQTKGLYLNSSNNCIKCKENQIFDHDRKECVCLEKYYFDEQNNCKPLKEDGTIECGINYIFDTLNKKCTECINDIQQNIPCVLSCKKEQYYDSKNRTCSKCLPLHSDQCQNTCNKNEFMDSIGICQPCHQQCSRCNGPLETNCLSCKQSLVLLPSLGICDRCEEGFFFDESTMKCEPCDKTCLTCSGKDPNQCKVCTGGNILSKVTNTCQNKETIQSELDFQDFAQQIGCFNKSKNKVDQDCVDRFEDSDNQTKIITLMAIINISLICINIIISQNGQVLGWIFIFDMQLLGNYILTSKLNPLWLNGFELKILYSHHLFTIIPNFLLATSNKQKNLFQLNAINTSFEVNEFSDSFFNNCFIPILLIGICLAITLLLKCALRSEKLKEDQRITLKIFNYIKWNFLFNVLSLASGFLIFNIVFILANKYKQKIEDLILIAFFAIIYLILNLYWNAILGFQYFNISYQDISSFQNLIKQLEISSTLSRLFWLIFEWKKVIITVIQAIFFVNENRQALSCWVHIVLNILFILFVCFQKPFINQNCNAIVPFFQVIHIIQITLLGIILTDEDSVSPLNISSQTQTIRAVLRMSIFGKLAISIVIQAFYLIQRAISYIQKTILDQSINQSQNTSFKKNMVEQITDENIEKIFEMLENQKPQKKLKWFDKILK
ncbi:hypothetical protein ABPG74_020692 [Tetrahymena malaccensis]